MDTREVRIGNRVIGGGNPVLIQSMTNTKTEDVQATVAQIKRLTAAGCEIIRCAVPTMEAAKALGEIKRQIGQYRLKRADSCGSRCGKREKYSNPGGCQQRFFRKRTGGKISWCNSRRISGECVR